VEIRKKIRVMENMLTVTNPVTINLLRYSLRILLAVRVVTSLQECAK